MAINLITGSGNFYTGSTDCLFGSASWTGSAAEDLYVRGFIYTDIWYDIDTPPVTSSLFVAQMNFDTPNTYTYTYTGLLSGSVTDLRSGSYSDYYVATLWGKPSDILYAFSYPPSSSGCVVNSQGQWQDASTGAWKTGYKFAFLCRKSDNTIASMCVAKYPVTSSDNPNGTLTNISPGVRGYFMLKEGGYYSTYYTDFHGLYGPGVVNLEARLMLKTGGVLATTSDPPPQPEPPTPGPTSSLSVVARTAGFFFP